jgi:hypothetical protein
MQNKFFEILFFLFFVKIVGGDEKNHRRQAVF